MKKLLSIALCLTLFFSFSAPALAIDTSLAVGVTVNGFRLQSKEEIKTISSELLTFEHEKTGAKVLYYKNSDLNRAFEIAFKTPTLDSTGVNHILEHTVLSSSDKYQGTDVFFTQMYNTYNTYTNAFTYPNMTAYPSASMSEAQLLKMADVTMCAMFFSAVRKDENIFRQEGWRYSLPSADAPLQRVGIVYNEMRGNDTLAYAADLNSRKSLFPNSILGNNSGGEPKVIPTLTYEHLQNTLSTYYHPSNSMTVLYGDLDYAKFLQLLDEYFAPFEKKDVKVDTGAIAPLTTPITATYEFATAAGSKVESVISYTFALPENTMQGSVDLGILASVLNHAGGPLISAFRAAGLGSNISVSMDIIGAHPTLTFLVDGADPSKAPEIQALIDKCLADAAKGLNKNVLEAVIAEELFATANMSEDPDVGVNMITATALLWICTGNSNYYGFLEDYNQKLPALAKSDYFEKLIASALLNNKHKALVTTTAKPGLLEEQAAVELAELAAIKAAMSPAEIEAMVKATAAFDARSESAEGDIDISLLQAITAKELPIEVEDYKISDTKKEGMRLLSTPATSPLTGYTSLYFDTSGVPVEKLYYLNLFAALLGNVRTKNYTLPELKIETSKNLNGLGCTASTLQMEKGHAPNLRFNWIGMMQDYDKNVELAEEILLQSNWDDLTAIKDYVMELETVWQQTLQTDPFQFVKNRAVANWGEEYAYQVYMNDVGYIDFLSEVLVALETNPAAVAAELKAIQSAVIGKANVTARFTSSEENIRIFENTLPNLMKKLPDNKIVKQDYSKIPTPTGHEGMATSGTVAYNVLDIPATSLPSFEYSKFLVLASLLTKDYLVDNLRFKGGAYGANLSLTQEGLLAYSYSDPNIKESYQIFAGIDEYMASLSLTQETLDGYITNTFGSLTRPKGALSSGNTAISNYLKGHDAARERVILENVRATTPAAVAEFVTLLNIFTEKGDRLTAASPEMLEANKDLFDKLIELGKITDPEAPVTRRAFLEALFGAGDAVIETCKAEGILLGDEHGDFLLDKPLTKVEAAVFLWRALLGKDVSGDKSIKDLSAIAPWAVKEVTSVVNAGLLALDNAGNFNPGEILTGRALDTLVAAIMATQNG